MGNFANRLYLKPVAANFIMSRFNPNITNEELGTLMKCAFPGPVEIVDTAETAARACAYLMEQPLLGFDTETRPSFKPGVVNKTALLQLSSFDRCFLFRLSRMKVTRDMVRVLESEDIIKVGAAVRDDIKGLQGLKFFKPRNFVDLQSIASEWGIEDKSVRKLAGIVLGQSVSKAQRLSNWEAANFTPAQIAYAATDAWVCLKIYDELMKEPK